MKYETPEMKALTLAIDAIHSSSIEVNKLGVGLDSHDEEGNATYMDWED